MKRVLVLLMMGMGIIFSVPALSYCNDENLKRHLNNLTNTLNPLAKLEASLSACRKWPVRENVSVLVMPFLKDDNDNFRLYSVDVVVINTISGEILQRLEKPLELMSDAVSVGEIVIDTAPYRLNKDTRAFGLRINYSGSSRVNPYTTTEFSLYIAKGKYLQLILDNVDLGGFQGEWDGNCEGYFSESKSTVIMGKSVNNKSADIFIKHKGKSYTRQSINNECEDVGIKIKTRKVRYKYTDGKYLKV
jgi:hypothetical protein